MDAPGLEVIRSNEPTQYDVFEKLGEVRGRAFGRNATKIDAIKHLSELRDSIGRSDKKTSFKVADLNTKIEDYLIGNTVDNQSSMIALYSTVDGGFTPDFFMIALQKIAEKACPDQVGIQRRLARTKWLDLGYDESTFSPSIEKLIEDELVRCGGFDKAKMKKWQPVVIKMRGHFMTMMMRWKGDGFLFVLPGTTGNTVFSEQNAVAEYPHKKIGADSGMVKLMELLCSVGHSTCQEHLKRSMDGQPHPAGASCTTGQSNVQIMLFEPGRQKDQYSCGVIALHDLFVFINEGGMQGLKGKQVYFVRGEPGSKEGMVKLVPEKVPGCELYKMTAYPPDLLRPTQNLVVFREEIERLKSVSEAYREKAVATEAEVNKWVRPSSSNPAESRHVNLYISHYTLDSAVFLSGGESTIGNMFKPS